MRQKVVAGNWKMHGLRGEAVALVQAILTGLAPHSNTETIVFPPFVYLDAVSQLVNGTSLALGAQNMNDHAKGAYTGEISPLMLHDCGCRYVLVGHSERRQWYGETNGVVALKAKAAIQAGLIPIICLGETLLEREHRKTDAVVAAQLQSVVECAGITALEKSLIAYEPVWAIGTGQTATPEEAEAVHRFLRDKIAQLDGNVAKKVRILYGGSVKPDNARGLFLKPNIDGALVGGASLNAQDFLAICHATE